jgi:hypothetical protein
MKNIDISALINRYRKLSPSYGIDPYSVTEIEIETLLFENNTDVMNILNEYTNLIAIGIWQDYSQSDLEDYIKSSKEFEYLDIEQHTSFLEFRLNQLSETKVLEQWKINQATIAFGLLTSIATKEGYKIKEFEDDELTKRIRLSKQKITYLIALA